MGKDLNRRDFLKGAAASAVGLASVGLISGCTSGEEPAVATTEAPVLENTATPVPANTAVPEPEKATYEATAKGFGGMITVTAIIQGEKLIEITAEGPAETPERGGVACEKLPLAMVAANGINVDGIAGATISSNAIKSAMEDILQQAGLSDSVGAVAMKPGIYVGQGWGFDWIEPVRVKIEVDETKLLSVDVIELELNREEPVIQQAVINLMIPRMIENQSVTVDAITGATGVSSGVKLATRDALKKALAAGGSSENAIRNFEKAPEKSTETKTLTYQVVVAGMGGAGTMAALSTAEQMTAAGMEVSVLAVETAGKYGGTAANAGEAFAINPPRYCQKYNHGADYTEDPQSLFDDWINNFTKGKCKEDLVKLLFDESGATIDWLQFDHNVHLHTVLSGFGAVTWPCKYQYIYKSNQEEGHDYSDTVLGDRSSTVGQYYDRLAKAFTDLGGEYLLETTCDELIYDAAANKVTGLKATGADGTKYVINADVVILAGGGFCGSPEMLEKYLKNDYFPLKSREWRLWGMYQNKGQMLDSAINQGAAPFNMGMVPCTHFKSTADILTSYPVYYRDGLEERMQEQNTWSLNDVPLILGISAAAMQIGPNGKRNYNEGGTFAFWKGGPAWYTIYGTDYLDNLAANGFAGDPGKYASSTKVYGQGGYPCARPIPQVYEVMEAAIQKGYVWKADTLEELAGLIGVPADALVAEVEKYRGFCAAKVDDDFQKSDKQLVDNIQSGPYYAIKCVATPYSTVAGLDVDTNINVLKTDGTVMNGLYACGNDSGGVLYTETDAYAQYGGVALGWAFTSGRLAGIHAVEYLQSL